MSEESSLSIKLQILSRIWGFVEPTSNLSTNIYIRPHRYQTPKCGSELRSAAWPNACTPGAIARCEHNPHAPATYLHAHNYIYIANVKHFDMECTRP